MKPTVWKSTVLSQICNLIPPYLVSKLSRKHGIDKQYRSFSPWSHVVAMLHCHLAHSISLNDVVDTLQNHSAMLYSIRQATPPSRNGLSHANCVRSADMAEELFWSMLRHLQESHPGFGSGAGYSGLPRRFKRNIYAIDATVITLFANCMDWAKHRRKKAAAKCHLQLNLRTFLPEVAIVKAGNTHDSTEAKELCANLKDGEIALFDKAYVDFDHLFHLHSRGVFWVTRAKSNMDYSVVGQLSEPEGNIVEDVLIRLNGIKAGEKYPEELRLVTAYVEVNGEMKKMSFITNNMTWAPSSVCELYKSRWGIEVFFKQIKQPLQIGSFLGYSKNAVRWQVWMAMLCYILLRFISYLGKWKGHFSRLFTLLRGVLLHKLEIFSVLEACGTARDPTKKKNRSGQQILPGF